MTIFDYFLTLGSIFIFLAYLNSFALTIMIMGLSIETICVNLELLGEKKPVKQAFYILEM